MVRQSHARIIEVRFNLDRISGAVTMSKPRIILVVLVITLVAGGVAVFPRIKSYLTDSPVPKPHIVKLTWDTSPKVTSYKIYRSLNRIGPYQQIGEAAGPPFFDLPTATPGTYFYTVTAANEKGESGYADPVQASLP